MRLDKLLANMGYGSRKDIKKIIKQQVISVDGHRVKDAGMQINPEKQLITVAGEPVRYQPYVYLMMNKPQGVISATEDQLHRTVIELVPQMYQKYQLFPIGRLDKDTEGLLLLTNDGAFAHSLMSPKRHVKKVYAATVEGEMTAGDKQIFLDGVKLDDGYVTKPSTLEILESGTISTIKLTLTEGKYHQVKRMVAAVGKKVLTLKREAIGGLELDSNLTPGSCRELSPEEKALAAE